MDRAAILEELTTIIVETRGVDEDEVTDGATLFDALGLESIDFLEISFRMEESFGFPFPTDDLGNIMNSVNEDSTTEDVNSALDTLQTDFHMKFDRSKVAGVSPFDATKLQESVLTLFTVGSLVDFVEARSAQ
ncbi:MAG: acyl carrier protein [Myxococcota bacterium]|nr:acyl carrier protein [Myxococcota bacterium]